MRRRSPSRLVGAAAKGSLLAVVLLAALAGPAAAHPATPSEYRSEVVGLSPPTDAVVLEVVGGDAFLRLAALPGHEVVVLGYQGEPYLRIDADGMVWVNSRSPSHYLNAERYAGVTLPDHADAEAAPQWEEVGSGGNVAWHDHRIHWMLPNPPPEVGRGERITEWEVTLVVDGETVTAKGSLWREPRPGLLLPVGAALASLALVAGVGLARRPVVPVAVVAVSLAALWLGWSELTATPPGFDLSLRSFSLAILPALAVLVAAGATALWLSGRRAVAELPLLGALVVLAFWAVPRLEVLWIPTLPTSLPADLDRTVFAAVIAAAAGAAAVTLSRGLTQRET